jgi:cytochrome c-type biogenesis protein CcmH/NrfG
MASQLEQIISGERTLNDVIGLQPQQIESIAMLGYQAWEQGRAEDAKAIFEGLTALDSKSYFGYAGLGAVALGSGNLDEAVEQLSKAIDLNPNDPTVRANLGEAYLRRSQLDKATEAFQAALTLDPNQRDAGANRARALLQGMSIVLAEIEKAQVQ